MNERFKSIAFGNYFEDRDQRIRRGVDSHHRAFFGGVRLAPDDEAVASVASARHFPDFSRELREIESYGNSPLDATDATDATENPAEDEDDYPPSAWDVTP